MEARAASLGIASAHRGGTDFPGSIYTTLDDAFDRRVVDKLQEEALGGSVVGLMGLGWASYPSPVEHRRHWWQRSFIRRAFVITVGADQFVTIGQARGELGLRKPWVGYLGNGHDLVWCTATNSGPLWAIDVGVTRNSLDREVAWWSGASAGARRSRKLRLVVQSAFGPLPKRN